MNNPINNKNLDELLKKSASESLDDFEKDALEGFNSLESPEEALDIKSQLDKRIYNEVFSKKKSGIKIYWYAAAGLFLMIGFSVFLFWNSNEEKKGGLAVMQNELNSPGKELPPSPEKDLQEPGELHDNAMAETKEVAKAEGKHMGQNSFSQNSQAGPVDALAKSKAPSDAENIPATPLQSEVNKSVPEQLTAKDDKGEMDYKRAEEQKPASESKARKNTALDLDEVTTTAGVKDELKSAGKEKTKEDRRKENQPGDSKLKKESGLENENSKTTAAGGYASENRNQPDNNKIVNREDKKAAENAPYSPGSLALPKGNTENSGSGNCHYSGGENTLVKELKEKLTKKNINKKFDAVLYINDAKKVEKIVFTELYDLKKDDETHIIEILQSLNKFEFFAVPTANSMREYKLLYRP
jgi:hypothetical protein